MTVRLGIIGYPLGHSLSPVIHRAALENHGLNISYEAWEVSPKGLRSFVQEIRTPQTDVLGFNVTVPHKEMVLAYLDEVSPEAKKTAAVNTVTIQEGRLTGHNTDGAGFIQAVKEEANFSLKDSRVLILGAGGAARGVVMALAAEDVRAFIIANRTVDRAKRLAKDLKRNWKGDLKTISLKADDLRKAAMESDLIVQCTTMGMVHGPAQEDTLLYAGDIASTALVYDLVYNPTETPLLREAKKARATALGGLSMLIRQGAIAFEMWTGRPAPVNVMFKAARDALGSEGSL
jgi:shikimate dehydrogenase